MRGRTRAFAAIAAMMMLAPVLARAELSLTARSAVVVDARTGAVLYDHNGDVPLPPASTTKVMTAVLALESGRLDDELTVSDYAAYTAPTRMGLRPGERVQLRNLVYAMLLKSANDASVVVAEGLAGSESRFAARMTAKAHLLGATTAHFENPNGLPVDGHVASARDLAVIFRYGLRYPQFREILGTRSIEVPVEAGGVHYVALRTHNRLLTGYSTPVIGKTGYTRAARRCFVGAATVGGREVVIALLGASDMWGDARRLLGAFGGDDAPPAPSLMMASIARTDEAGVDREVRWPRTEVRTTRVRKKVHGRWVTRTVRTVHTVEAPRATRHAARTAPTRGKATRTTYAKAGAARPGRQARTKTSTKQARSVRAATTPVRGVRTARPGRYAVTIGPYSSQGMADRVRSRLERDGYAVAQNGSSLKVHGFASREHASNAAAKLRVSGYRSKIVARD